MSRPVSMSLPSNDVGNTRPKSMHMYTDTSLPARTQTHSSSNNLRPPINSRRHTLALPSSPSRRPLRSSPLAGPAISSNNNSDDHAADHKRATPSRIASASDLPRKGTDPTLAYDQLTVSSHTHTSTTHTASASSSSNSSPESSPESPTSTLSSSSRRSRLTSLTSFSSLSSLRSDAAKSVKPRLSLSFIKSSSSARSPTSPDTLLPKSTSTTRSPISPKNKNKINSSPTTTAASEQPPSPAPRSSSYSSDLPQPLSHLNTASRTRTNSSLSTRSAFAFIPDGTPRPTSSLSTRHTSSLSTRPTSSLSTRPTSPAADWMTTNTYGETPRFSRLSLAGQGVVLPVKKRSSEGGEVVRRASVKAGTGATGTGRGSAGGSRGSLGAGGSRSSLGAGGSRSSLVSRASAGGSHNWDVASKDVKGKGKERENAFDGTGEWSSIPKVMVTSVGYGPSENEGEADFKSNLTSTSNSNPNLNLNSNPYSSTTSVNLSLTRTSSSSGPSNASSSSLAAASSTSGGVSDAGSSVGSVGGNSVGVSVGSGHGVAARGDWEPEPGMGRLVGWVRRKIRRAASAGEVGVVVGVGWGAASDFGLRMGVGEGALGAGIDGDANGVGEMVWSGEERSSRRSGEGSLVGDVIDESEEDSELGHGVTPDENPAAGSSVPSVVRVGAGNVNGTRTRSGFVVTSRKADFVVASRVKVEIGHGTGRPSVVRTSSSPVPLPGSARTGLAHTRGVDADLAPPLQMQKMEEDATPMPASPEADHMATPARTPVPTPVPVPDYVSVPPPPPESARRVSSEMGYGPPAAPIPGSPRIFASQRSLELEREGDTSAFRMEKLEPSRLVGVPGVIADYTVTASTTASAEELGMRWAARPALQHAHSSPPLLEVARPGVLPPPPPPRGKESDSGREEERGRSPRGEKEQGERNENGKGKGKEEKGVRGLWRRLTSVGGGRRRKGGSRRVEG